MAAPLSGNGVRLDMTPMVDVAFLLLIFFMSTSAIRSANDPQVALPASQAGAEIEPGGRVVIAVEQDGDILFSSGHARPVPVALEDVGARAKGVLATEPNAQIVVFADAKVAYGRMSEVFRTLQASELFRFSLVTEQEES